MLILTNTGNGERGTRVWERVYSGKPYENLKWRTKETKREQLRKCHGCKGEFLLAVHPDDCTFLLAQSPIAGLQCHPIKNINRSPSMKRR